MKTSTRSRMLTVLLLLGCACGGDGGAADPTSGAGSGATSAAGASTGSNAGAGGTSVAGMTGAGSGAVGAAGGSNTGGAGAAAGMNAAGAAGNLAAGSGAAGSGTAGSSAAGSGAAGSGTAGMGAAGATAGAGASTGPLTLTSTAVQNGAMLPKKHRCVMFNGNGGVSPALAWSGGPAAKSYAVTLHDLTANIMHWTIYDIPAGTTSLPEGVPIGAMPATPAGAKQTPNQLTGMTGPGYFGPCGGANRNMYEFAVYALDVDTLPGLSASSTAAQARMAITMHTLPMGRAALGITSSSNDP